MPVVSEIEVTYGDTIAPSGFHKATAIDKSIGQLNRGAGGQPSYLWTRESSTTLDPIVELYVSSSIDGDIPAGFERVHKNLLRGCEAQHEAYICYRRGRTEDPIGAIFVLYSDQIPDSEEKGIEMVAEPILRDDTGSVVRLCFRRSSKDEATQKISTVRITAAKYSAGSTWALTTVMLDAILHKMRTLDAAPDGTLSDILWGAELPDFIHRILLSTFESVTVVPAVNRFLQQVLCSLAAHIRGQRTMTIPKIRLIIRLFGYEKPYQFYYLNYGQGDAVNDSMLKPSDDYQLDGPLFKFSSSKTEKPNVYTSRLLCTNINIFCAAGGFEGILNALSTAPIMFVHQYIYLVTNLRDRMVSSFTKEYASKFMDEAFSRLHCLQVEDHRPIYNDEESWSTMINNLKFFVDMSALKGYSIHEAVELCWCSIAKLFLTSPTIAIRVRGVVLLDYHILSAIKRSEETETITVVQQKCASVKYMTGKLLCKWVLDPSNLTLGIILGIPTVVKALGFDGPHNEILKRSSTLFCILAKENMLSESVFDRLWEISRDAANNDVPLHTAALHLLAETAPFMSNVLLDKLARKIVILQPPLHAGDVAFVFDIVQLVLTTSSANSDEDANKFGFSLLWNTMHMSLDSDVSKKAGLYIGMLLSSNVSMSFALAVVKQALDMIQANVIKCQPVINTILSILERLPIAAVDSQKSPHKPNRLMLIKHAEESLGLINILLESMDRLLDHKDDSVARNETLASGFALLKFVLSNCLRQLQTTEVEALLRRANDSRNIDILSIVYSWLGSICPVEVQASVTSNSTSTTKTAVTAATIVVADNPLTRCISNDTVCGIFELILQGPKETLSTLDKAAFGTIDKYFRALNYTKNAISNSSSDLLTVNAPESIVGIDLLRRLYLECTDESVMSATCNLITLVYRRISEGPKRKSIFSSFAIECFEIVKTLYGSADLQALKKSLDLISSYLSALTESSRFNMKEDFSSLKTRVIVQISLEGSATKYQQGINFYTVKKSTSLGSFRSRIAADIGTTAQYISLSCQKFNLGREADSQPIPTVPNTPGLVYVHAVVQKQPCSDLTSEDLAYSPCQLDEEDPDGDQYSPRKHLAATPGVIELLLRLLSHENSSIAESAWNVLDLLPTNVETRDSIFTLLGRRSGSSASEIDTSIWCNILDDHVSLALLYKISIILDMQFDTSDVDASRDWSRAFTSCGGLAFLLKLIVDDTTVQGMHPLGRLHIRCYSALYKTLVANVALAPGSVRSDGYLGQILSKCAHLDKVSLSAITSTVTDRKNVVSQILNTLRSILLSGKEILAPTRASAVTDTVEIKSKRQKRDLSAKSSDASAGGNMKSVKPSSILLDDVAAMICFGFEIIFACGNESPEVFDYVASHPSLSFLLSTAIMESLESSIRMQSMLKVSQLLELSSKNSPAAASSIFQTLLTNLPALATLGSQCSEMIQLLVSTVENLDGRISFDREQCIVCLIDNILSRPVVETSPDTVDQVLTGYLRLLAAILNTGKIPIARLSHIWMDLQLFSRFMKDCLFAVADSVSAMQQEYPKCKSEVSRAAAFQVLSGFSKQVPEVRTQILSFLAPLHALVNLDRAPDGGTKYHKANFTTGKSHTGFGGIYNPGCICYMISSLQQLYMVPSFRQAVLNLTFGGSVGVEKKEESESFLFQLQRLFANLQESSQPAYDLRDFCHAFKDFEGNPTNIAVQQDGAEFVTNFFQQVENDTVGSMHEHIVKYSFGGVFSHEILADGGRYSERLENFYCIPVPMVAKSRSIQEALGEFILGENVDYTWESTDAETGEVKKESLPTSKRCSIAVLPKHLILHLKRFEFNYDTMVAFKLNPRLEFPHELDLYPYTKQHRHEQEAREREANGSDASAPPVPVASDKAHQEPLMPLTPIDCIYSLAGVVVHTGTAQSGHYYSFVKERGQFEEDTGKWFEFNDSYVGDFDVDELENEAYGGVDTTTGKEKVRNAFILVYDKKTDKCSAVAPLPAISGTVSKFKAELPLEVSMPIWKDNVEYGNTKNLFDKSHARFMSTFLLDDFRSPETWQCSLHYVFSTLVRAGEEELLRDWIIRLQPSLLASPEAATQFIEYLLDSNGIISLFSLLFSLEGQDTQRVVMELLAGAVSLSIESLPVLSKESLDESIAVELLNTLYVDYLRAAQYNWKRIRYYFTPFLVFIRKSMPTAIYSLTRKDYMIRFIQFLLAEHARNVELIGGSEPVGHLSRSMEDGITTVPLDSLLDVFCAWIDVLTDHWDRGGRKQASSFELVPVKHCKDDMSNMPFFYKVIKQLNNLRTRPAVNKILSFLIIRSKERSDIAFQVLRYCIKVEDGQFLKPAFRAAMMLLSEEDELTRWRLENTMSLLAEQIFEVKNYIIATDISVIMYLRIVKYIPLAREWFAKKKDSVVWIEQYLKIRKEGNVLQNSVSYKNKLLNKPTSKAPRFLVPQENFDKYHLHARMAQVGRAISLSEYDSDNEGDMAPEGIVGRGIRVKLSDTIVREGTIVEYDEDTNNHIIDFGAGLGRQSICLFEKKFELEQRV